MQYYFCSGGSIYAAARGSRRMGKYMRKGKGVGKMEVSQGSLGVRTRARALALEKERASKFSFYHTTTITTSSIKSSESSRALPLESQPHYMELRSRRFEKVARCEKAVDHETAQASGGELLGQLKNISFNRPPSFPSPSPSPEESHAFGEEHSGIKIQNSSSSTQDISRLASAPPVAGSDAKNTRHPPPAQSSLHSAVKGSSLSKPVAATDSSTQSLGYSAVSIPQKRPMGMRTRNQRHELACRLPNQNQKAMEVDTEMVSSEAAGASNKNEKEMEVEPCFGESPMIAGPSSKDRHYEPNTSRSTRECTPDSFIRDVEAPGSTSRTRHSSQVRSLSAPLFGRSNEAPTSSEIEAFFASAEQQERRRFVDRYNFDPLTERPLRGRYEWLNM